MTEPRTPSFEELTAFPGGGMVARGLMDARARVDSIDALVVSLAVTRLRAVGLDLPEAPRARDGELVLYERLRGESDSYGRYNALRRDLTSFLDAFEAHMRCASR